MRVRRVVLIVMGLTLAVLGQTAAVFAQASSDVRMDSPVRALKMGPREVRADLTVNLHNEVGERRIVKIELSDLPEGWDIGVWDRFFDFIVQEVVVEPSSDDSPSQTLRLRIDLPDERPASGTYSLRLRVTSPDGAVEYDSARYSITVPNAPVDEDQGVTVKATFPVLRGPATSAFEFEIVIDNETGADSSFSLEGEAINGTRQALEAWIGGSGQALVGWDIGYIPSFGDERLISSVSVGSALSERVDVRVQPPRNTPPGDYFVPIRVADDAGFEALTALQVTIRGRGEIAASTDTGLLNIDAIAGEAARSRLRLTNFGTAELTDVSLTADGPQGWEITFEPDAVPSLPANNLIDVPVNIVPVGDAIPGDYLITLRASHPDTHDQVELRVTVAQSTIWGWLGIVLVVLVIGGLAGLFWRLGRR